jgi:hypothetical protein
MGHDEELSRNEAAVTNTSWQNSSPQPLACPRCGKDDQLQRVSTIVDSGTSQTTGFGIGAVVAGAGGQHPIGVAGYEASNRSYLAQRLAGFAEPRASWETSFLIAWLPLTVLGVVIFIYMDGGPIWWVLGLLVSPVVAAFTAVLPMWAIKAIRDRRLAPERERWRRNLWLLREAYYCHRDDLVVAPEGSGTPEEFMNWRFSQP